MKRILGLILTLGLLTGPAFAIDEWAKGEVAGTRNVSDIDSYVATNNNALDRLVVRYKRGLGINYSSAATLSVLAGEIAIPDATDSVVRWRRLSAGTSIGWADIDTGVEANSTQYYVYAVGDTASTSPTFKISTSSSAPSGITYYIKIGEFYNDSSGNITNVISYRQDYGTDYQDVAKGWINFNGSGTIAINDSYNVSSITDNGTGDYTVTWSTAFANAYYACAGNVNQSMSGAGIVTFYGQTASLVKMTVRDVNGTANDVDGVSLVAFGDRV